MPEAVIFLAGFLTASVIWAIGLTYVGYRSTKGGKFLSND